MMSPETAVNQASITAEIFMEEAFRYFREKGVDNPHPVLVAAYVQACSADFHSAVQAKAVSF